MTASETSTETTTRPTEAPDSRPSSLWPDSTQAPAVRGTLSGVSRFDPLHEDSGRARERLASHFDVCRGGLALRLVLAVQLAVALGSMLAAPNAAAWLRDAPVLAFAALAASLLWLPAVCACRWRLSRWSPGGQWLAVTALGAAASLAAWAVLLPLELAAPGPWRAGVVAAGGAGAGATL
ncbi:MAG: sensor histidine kinase, partial [Aquabacterium sp.]